MSKTRGYLVGEVVWAIYRNYPWWPVEICDPSEPVGEPVPSGCYVFKFAEGKFGYASPNNIKPLSEMTLQEAVCNLKAKPYKDRIHGDYDILIKKNSNISKVATTRPQLIVNLSKKTQGLDEYIEVFARVKKRKLNTGDMEDSSDDETMKDSIPEDMIDPYEMDQILQVYNNKGFLGILEHFGMTFANLKFSLDRMDMTDKKSFAYQIYQKNATMDMGLKQYLCEFLTSFSTQFSKDFEYYPTNPHYSHFLEGQFEEAKTLAEKLFRLSPTDQHEMLLTTIPPLFLPLFRLKNMIECETHLVKMTFQEYFIMTFKMFPIFSDIKGQGIFFKTSESLESDNLKLSLNIMNKKWVENTTRMQTDFVLVRYSQYKHYFVIGEFENQNITASTAEEFLCVHKDTLKIILEGRAVLKDIATKLSACRVSDQIKKKLVVMLFLADTSGKVVILKMRPIFHKIQKGLHGIYYEISYSRLLNIFNKTDACTLMSEISNSVKYACDFLYDIDQDCSITNVCAIPITLKSKSNLAKLIRIPVISSGFSSVYFEEKDEANLFDFLSKEFPNLLVEKERIVRLDEIGQIQLRFSVDPDAGSISMYGNEVTEVYGNPIYGCYPISRRRELKCQVISLTNFKNIEYYNYHLEIEDNDDQDFKKRLAPNTPPSNSKQKQNTSSPHTPKPQSSDNDFRKKIQDDTFTSWGLQNVENKIIHTRTYNNDLISYIFYCEGVLTDGAFPVFIKIHSGHPMITYNADCVTKFACERIQASLDAKHTIKIYKYFIEKRSVPYEIFGDISTSYKGYITDVTISELLTTVENSIFSQVKLLDDNAKILTLLYVMDGCIRGINYMANHLKLLHNDIAFRNVMIRKNATKSSISYLIDQYCNFTLTDDVVISDINNCKKIGIGLEFMNDMKCLAKVFIEFISFLFGNSSNGLQSLSNMENQFYGDFKMVHLWIVQTIESFQTSCKKSFLSEFQDIKLRKVVQPLDEMVINLLVHSSK